MEKGAGVKVLYLSEWYPNRYDNASGRFVRGHAISAVRQGVDVCVLYINKALPEDDPSIFFQETEGVKEVYVYYHGSFLAALRRGWKYVHQCWGDPDLCQLNVLSKNAILPVWLKLRYGIPYIIVEHCTSYYPESDAFKGIIRHWLMGRVVRQSQMVLAVSTELAKHMQRHGLKHDDYRLIRNVVYDIFYHSQTRKKDGMKRFLHVSFFNDAHKNVSDIIRAICLLSKERQDFECIIVGDGNDREKLLQLEKELAIPAELIRWTGELEPQEVCDLFYQSDFFVFYSNYETAGIVLTESLACGKPVISTPVGIAPDIITSQTGVLVPKHQPEELAKAMNWMLDHYGDYDPSILSAVGREYSVEKVGMYLKGIYEEVCTTCS